MIRIEKITKTFGSFFALRGIDWEIRPGEFWVVVGPNGAGKTTLMKIIATLSHPSSGSIALGDTDSRNKISTRRKIGFIGHQSLLYPNLTAEENLKFYARMYRLSDANERIRARLTQVDLSDRKDDLVRNFSRGMQQRLTIARALLSDPEIILLDEPFSGLDQQGIDLFNDLLKSLISPKRIIILITHNLALGWELATHYAMMSRGKIVEKQMRGAISFADFKDRYRKLTGGGEA
ncbi:MAG: heme ABC exporter ATP-binding protein CcmA [Calditrichaeota bacterium]|nr:heme ABC exporter ATP-binding protein CcmA [Calditrichota bacterium]